MNVYDFDDTIYAGNSMMDFYLFCVKKHPAILQRLPRQGVAMLRYAQKKQSKDDAKSAFYAFLLHVPNIEAAVLSFWQSHQKKIRKWYLLQKKADDIIISASPFFVLAPICKTLGAALIATEMDAHTGEMLGPNCKGEEKVTRFLAAHPGAIIDAFYSDSLSDAPMAALAKKAVLVKKDEMLPWPSGR